jgi:hypothetical protein
MPLRNDYLDLLKNKELLPTGHRAPVMREGSRGKKVKGPTEKLYLEASNPDLKG